MIDAQAPLLYTPLRERVFSKLQPETASSEAITVPITSGYFFVSQYWQGLKLGDRAEFAKSVSESDIDLYAGSTYLRQEVNISGTSPPNIAEKILSGPLGSSLHKIYALAAIGRERRGNYEKNQNNSGRFGCG